MNAALPTDRIDITQLFKEFYDAVRTVKCMVERNQIDWNMLSDEEVPADMSQQEVTRRLASYLSAALSDQMEVTASNTSAIEYAAYKQAAYLMAALADEIFLIEVNWFGTDHWHDYSIESKLFSTCYAGDEYYIRLSDILKRDVLSSLEKQLAIVFVWTLSLGFRGRLRGNETMVTKLRRRLLPKTGYASAPKVLFPDAYGAVINPATASKLEPLSRWHSIIAALLLIYLLISSGIWLWLTSSFFRGLGAT